MLTIGDYSYGSPEIRGVERGDNQVKIGRFCSIATGVVAFIDNGEHELRNVSTFPFYDKAFGFVQESKLKEANNKGITIRNDVWLCQNVHIFPGVTIGDGAVIGADAVVRRNIPPYAVVMGNPAQIVKYRFNPSQIESLLAIRWWDWPRERFTPEFLNLLMGRDVDAFINYCNAHKT